MKLVIAKNQGNITEDSINSRLVKNIEMIIIVKSILKIRRKLEIDASDALGVAICHGITFMDNPDNVKSI